MNIDISMVQVIQAMLAPGIMISACGLLLLGMNNKYSLVVNRIRLLGEEKRRFFAKAGEKELEFLEEVRIKSIQTQLDSLIGRLLLVRNAVFSYCVAVALFVVTSLLIGFEFATRAKMTLGIKVAVPEHSMETVIIVPFLMGMASVLVGVVFAAGETVRGFNIVQYEISTNE